MWFVAPHAPVAGHNVPWANTCADTVSDANAHTVSDANAHIFPDAVPDAVPDALPDALPDTTTYAGRPLRHHVTDRHTDGNADARPGSLRNVSMDRAAL